MNILFMCKYNRFRSRIAKSYFEKINKNKNIKAESAGIIKGSPLNKKQIDSAKKFKLNIKGNPKTLTSKLLKQQNFIVIVADDVPESIFNKLEYKNNFKLINLKVPDVKDFNDKGIEKTIKIIIKKIDILIKQLENKNEN